MQQPKHNEDMIDTLLTAREAAEKLGLQLSTVRSMVSRGTLRSVATRFGRLIDAESVQDYAENRLGQQGRPPAG